MSGGRPPVAEAASPSRLRLVADLGGEMLRPFLTFCVMLGLVVGGDAAAASKTMSIGPADRAVFAAGMADGMRRWPDARVIEKYYPDDFKRMVDAAVDAVLAKGSLNLASPQTMTDDVAPAFTAVRNEVIDREYPKASPENVRAMMQLVVDRAKAARARSPRECAVAIGLARGKPKGARDMLDDPYLQRMGKISADILEQTATHPSPPPEAPDPEALHALNLEAAAALPSESLDALVESAEIPSERWNTGQELAACLFYTRRIEILLERPNDEDVRLYWAMRYGGPTAPWAGRQSR